MVKESQIKGADDREKRKRWRLRREGKTEKRERETSHKVKK